MKHQACPGQVDSIFRRKPGYWGKTELHLPAEVTAKTGFIKAVGLVFEDTKRIPCSNDQCDQDAFALRCRILSVVDTEGRETSINQLDPTVSKIINGVETRVKLCAKHLIEQYIDSVQGDQGNQSSSG